MLYPNPAAENSSETKASAMLSSCIFIENLNFFFFFFFTCQSRCLTESGSLWQRSGWLDMTPEVEVNRFPKWNLSCQILTHTLMIRTPFETCGKIFSSLLWLLVDSQCFKYLALAAELCYKFKVSASTLKTLNILLS